MVGLDALSCWPEREDQQRIMLTLDHLMPHLSSGECAIVGGLAIRQCVMIEAQPYPPRKFNDMDMTVSDPEAVVSSMIGSFGIGHFHETADGPFFAVVDPETRVRIDIFPWPRHQQSLMVAKCGAYSLPFASPEEQLAKTICDTTRVLRDQPVEPKQFTDADLLSKIADPALTSRIFASFYGDLIPAVSSAQQAFAQAKRAAAEHPELVKPRPFERPYPTACTKCSHVAKYPLMDLPDFRNLLGYSE